MQMRVEEFVGVLPDGGDLLAASDLFAATDEDFVQVRVERADATLRVVLVEEVFDDDDVAPETPAVLGEDDAAVGDGADGLAEVCAPAARAVPVFAGVEAEAVALGEGGRLVPALVALAGRGVGVRAAAVCVAEGEVEA